MLEVIHEWNSESVWCFDMFVKRDSMPTPLSRVTLEMTIDN